MDSVPGSSDLLKGFCSHCIHKPSVCFCGQEYPVKISWNLELKPIVVKRKAPPKLKKRSRNPKNLLKRRPEMTPLKSKPCTCKTCGSIVLTKHRLKKHMINVHGAPGHPCEICNCKFVVSGDLNRHFDTAGHIKMARLYSDY
jgi:hypothetical protein